MKIFDFIFQDFWRKLVALIFAVVIYWQSGGFAKKPEPRTVAPQSEPVEVEGKIQIEVKNVSRSSADLEFPVGIIADGSGRRVSFAPGVEPRVKATLRGEVLSDIRDSGDLRFYVDAAGDLKPGEHMLPVLYNNRRSGVSVISVTPDKIRISIGENPVDNHK